MQIIEKSSRWRTTPFQQAIINEGVTSFTIYNGMYLPESFGDPIAEYWRLINGVALWDVSCERQVELYGPDAGKCAQILATRDLSACKIGQGKYVALCNYQGTIINDPICLKLAEDHYWLSIADSNILYWATAIANERGLNVRVSEPDVSPLALQGPLAENVVAHVCGDWVRDLKYFWFKQTKIDNIPVLVQRSGWSKQGGFEIYLCDGRYGDKLYNIMREAGKQYDIGPGNPNHCERIESGLFSCGADSDGETNPFEVRMEKYVDLHLPDEVVGMAALKKLYRAGIKRHQLGIILENNQPLTGEFSWVDIYANGKKIGSMTNMAWSLRLLKNIGFALVSREYNAGDNCEIQWHGQRYKAKLVNLPFI